MTGPDTPDADRALSDLIGFVLTFAIIIGAVGLVSTFGLSALNDLQQNEQQRNAERSFQILAENFETVTNRNAPERTSEINLRAGTLRAQNETTIRVQATGSGPGPVANFDRRFFVHSLVYEQGETTLAYESGATFRAARQGEVLVTDPSLVCSGNSAIVSLVTLEPASERSFGSGTLQVTGALNETRLLYPQNRSGRNGPTAADDVTVTFDSPNREAWVSYLDRQTNWDRVSSDTVVCQNVDRVYVRETSLTVSFTR